MKNTAKIIVFMIFFLSIATLLNQVLKIDKVTKKWYQFSQIPENSIDIFFAGNSRSYMTIQPQIIQDITSLSGYVLGVGGESLEMTYIELSEMFETQSPRYVFLEVFPITKYEIGRINTNQADDFFYSIPLHELQFSVIWNFFVENNFQILIPISNYHGKIWKTPHEIFSNYVLYSPNNINKDIPKQIKDFSAAKGYKNGYMQISQQSINDYSQSYPIIQTTISTTTEELLQKIITLCQKNNAQLILWQIPQYTKFVDQNGIDLDFQMIADENQILFYDLNQYYFDIMNFADINHVAPFGSQNVSLLLAQIIADEYSGKKNIYGLDQYKKISPIDYEYELNNNQFIVSFTMASDLQNSQVIATLEAQETIYTGEIVNLNQIQFVLPEKPTSDYVNVTFENLQINRSISQYVYLNYTNKEHLP